MSFLKILGWGFFIGIIMSIFQMMHVSGQLDIEKFYLFDENVTAPLNLVPFYDNIKLFLEVPEKLYDKLALLNPTKSSFFIGIEGLTGVRETGFLNFLLYLTTFTYYFLLTIIFAKSATLFPIERDQKVFFSFCYIIYIVVIKILGSL